MPLNALTNVSEHRKSLFLWHLPNPVCFTEFDLNFQLQYVCSIYPKTVKATGIPNKKDNEPSPGVHKSQDPKGPKTVLHQGSQCLCVLSAGETLRHGACVMVFLAKEMGGQFIEHGRTLNFHNLLINYIAFMIVDDQLFDDPFIVDSSII